MKNLTNFRLLLLLFLSILVLESCSRDNDDDILTNDPEAVDNNDGDQNGEDDNQGDEDPDQQGEAGNITLYRVDGLNIVKQRDFEVSGKLKELQDDVAKHQEVWNLVKRLVPESYLRKLSEFMIFAGENNGTAGYVFNTKQDLSEWHMGLAIDFAYEGGSLNADGQFAYTIIHEFAHVLTLDNTQVDASISQEACANYFVGEGCAKQPSYINKLFQNFWSDIAKEHGEIGEEDQEGASRFYEKYKDRFVTAYASTNPAEDIAEVFTNFVLQNNKPSGNTIAERKILLMYEHPELVEFRNYIREQQQSGRTFIRMNVWDKAITIGKHKTGHCSHL